MADKETGRKSFFGKLMDVISGNPTSSTLNQDTTGQFAPKENDPIDVRFVEQFTHNDGKFLYCGTKNELIDGLKNIIEEHQLQALGTPDGDLMSLLKGYGIPKLYDDLKECDAIFTNCEALIAFTGGIMINEHQTKGIRIDDMPKYHIVFGKTSQLVESLHDAMSRVNHLYRNNRPGQISVLKGPKDEHVMQASADPNKNRVLFLVFIEDTF